MRVVPVIVGSAEVGAGNMNPPEEDPVPVGGVLPVLVALPVNDPVHSAPEGQHAMLFPESWEQMVPDWQQTSELPRSVQGLWLAGQLFCRFTSLRMTSGSGLGSGFGSLVNGEWNGERSIAKAVVERREAVRRRVARMVAVEDSGGPSGCVLFSLGLGSSRGRFEAGLRLGTDVDLNWKRAFKFGTDGILEEGREEKTVDVDRSGP